MTAAGGRHRWRRVAGRRPPLDHLYRKLLCPRIRLIGLWPPLARTRCDSPAKVHRKRPILIEEHALRHRPCALHDERTAASDRRARRRRPNLSPSGGRVPPGRFIQEHIESGLLHAIDDWPNICFKQELGSNVSVSGRVPQLLEPPLELRFATTEPRGQKLAERSSQLLRPLCERSLEEPHELVKTPHRVIVGQRLYGKCYAVVAIPELVQYRRVQIHLFRSSRLPLEAPMLKAGSVREPVAPLVSRRDEDDKRPHRGDMTPTALRNRHEISRDLDRSLSSRTLFIRHADF
jgi:hypothetical protein